MHRHVASFPPYNCGGVQIFTGVHMPVGNHGEGGSVRVMRAKIIFALETQLLRDVHFNLIVSNLATYSEQMMLACQRHSVRRRCYEKREEDAHIICWRHAPFLAHEFADGGRGPWLSFCTLLY